MNIPRAIETAFCEVLRARAEIGAGTVLRSWQSLNADAAWTENKDRKFPCVDVRCSPPAHPDAMPNGSAECALLFCSKIDDDRTHAKVSELYEAGQSILDAMFSQFRKRTDGEELTQFKASLAESLGDDFEFSAIQWGDPVAPYTDAGISIIGLRVRVVFIRKNYI
jgi:hypothetical protein